MQVIMKGKLIPVFVLAALVSCSQPPVKEQGPRPVKLADVTSLNMVEKSFSGVVSPDQFSDLAFKMSGPLISLNVDEGRITIFRSTLEALGWPSHYRFLYNPQMNQIAVQVCSAADAGAHRVGKLNEFSSCEIKCVAFVRMVYKNAKWDKRRSYRMIGNPFPEQRLVSFQIQEALPIENGRVLDGTVSPTFALCRAEGSPSQNNPTPEEKADSGAM